MTTPWEAHRNRGSFKPSEHVGELAFITVLSEQEESTMNGPAMTIRANITLLDGPEAGSTHPNVTLFGAPIVRDLLGSAGSTRLARFGSSPSRTPGLNPAVFLSEPLDSDADIAQRAWSFHEAAYTKRAPWDAQAAPVAPEPAQSPAKTTPAKRASKKTAAPSSPTLESMKAPAKAAEQSEDPWASSSSAPWEQASGDEKYPF